jgi:hypothetical protein
MDREAEMNYRRVEDQRNDKLREVRTAIRQAMKGEGKP